MNKLSKYYRSSVALMGGLVFAYGAVIWLKVSLDDHLRTFRRDAVGAIKQDRSQYRTDLKMITASLKRIEAQLGSITDILTAIESESVDLIDMGADSGSSTNNLVSDQTLSEEQRYNVGQEALASRQENPLNAPDSNLGR